MQGDFAGLRVQEITFREEVEVGVDLLGADAWNLFRNQFFVDHLLALEVALFNRVAEQEAFQGDAKEGGVESVLVAVPERSRGAAGVAKRVGVKIAKLFGVANQFRKGDG